MNDVATEKITCTLKVHEKPDGRIDWDGAAVTISFDNFTAHMPIPDVRNLAQVLGDLLEKFDAARGEWE